MATLAEPRVSNFFSHLQGTHRFSVADYFRMTKERILTSADHVELLDGYILYKLDYVELQPSEYFPEYAQLRRWTGEEYLHLIQLGLLTADDKVELLDGYLVTKMSQNVPHRAALLRLSNRLMKLIPTGWSVMIQSPLDCDGQFPEPDVMVVRGNESEYDSRHPKGSDFGIVFEVSDSTLSTDRKYKLSVYALEAIPCYWIVNVANEQIEVYTDPTPTGYATRTDFKPGDVVPLVLDGVEVAKLAVADLMPS
jgi:Uma2 family endonuclease